MQRKSPILLAAGSLILAALTIAAAPKDGQRTGQQLYKEYCKGCHLADSPNGEYTPMSLIQDQWKDFFDTKLVPAHEAVVDPAHEGKKVLDLMTPEETKVLRDWTIDHAADSEHPMTCG